jgi:hypothetical protein
MSSTSLPAGIALDPADWFLAGWRNLPPLPLPAAEPFDREDCLKRLGKVKLPASGWNWLPAGIAPALTVEEARFWLWAMVHASSHHKAGDLAARMGKQATDEPPSDDEMLSGFRGRSGAGAGVGPELAPVLWAAFSPEELLRRYFVLWPVDERQRRAHGTVPDHRAAAVCMGFLRFVRPYLSREQLQPVQDVVGRLFRDCFKQSNWVPHAVANLARAVDLHEELRMLVASWPDGRLSYPYSSGGADAGLLLFGLGDGAVLLHEMQRLSMRLNSGHAARAFLAHTGTTALPTLRDHILAAARQDLAEELTEVFSLVQTAEAAPLMLELIVAGKGAAAARRWLDAQRTLAIGALLPLAGERGALADAALSYLRDTVRAGHTALIEQAIAADGNVPERVRKVLLTAATAAVGAFEDASLPEWFQKARPQGKVKLPAWLDPAAVSPITIQGRCLAPEHLASVLGVLKDSTLATPGAMIGELKKHADRAALEGFAWDLFERWQGAGSPPKDRWAMSGLGLLGGDSVCLRLWPLVRDWPGQAQHKRAVHGLECLRAIGSEQALLQLHKLAEKVKFPALKRQAQRFMEEIAAQRGLTPGQLEDRIVPDLGLDEQGTRVLDYGPRQFRVALGPDLKPRVRQDDGTVRGDLPRGTAKDDEAKVAATQADWKLFKQQLKEVLKAQAERLEKAMSRRRRWSAAELDQHLLRHPFMRYLARVLVWAGFDSQGKVVKTFRVTEDQTLADVAGEPVTLDPDWAIGIVHPVLLPAEEVAAWAEVLADHEILPPFPQLGRKVFTLEPAEGTEKVLRRFEGAKVPGMALLGATKKTGWEQGSLDANHRITHHLKRYPEVGLTAILSYRPGLEPFYGYGSVEDQELVGCCFVPEGVKAQPENALPLGSVDVLVLNEVAGLMIALSGKKG